MKKKDLILAGSILLLAIIWIVVRNMIPDSDDRLAIVTVNNEIYGQYSLEEDQRIEINDTNILVIADGKADMIEADCPDQICVDQKSISKSGESIVCLPNKVVVSIQADEQPEFDAIAN